MELKPQKLESKPGAHPLAINRRSAFIGRNQLAVVIAGIVIGNYGRSCILPDD